MPLDFTILELRHILFFALAFLVTYPLIGWLISMRPPILRAVPGKPNTHYAGALVVGIITLISYLVLDDPGLRIGLLAAGFLTLFIGIIDENRSLPPSSQLIWQVTIAFVAVSWGWSIQYVSDPFGSGVINLATMSIGPILLPGSILAVGWLLLLMNAVNWLDGVDGQAAGVGTVALLTLAAVSLLPSTQDSRTLLLALVGAGSVLGFLVWNFPPARVYLGTSGSWFLGLFIGIVAIIGGGKIVTTLLVLAIPVVDLLLVIIQRLAAGRAPWLGDKTSHLHHRLLTQGFKPRSVAIIAITSSLLLGIAAVTLQTQQKMIAFIAAAVMLAVVALHLVIRQNQRVI